MTSCSLYCHLQRCKLQPIFEGCLGFALGVSCLRLQDAADLLHVHCLPQWPVAATALQRLVTMLGSSKGLGHSDSGVRQICVDLLSLVAAQLFLDAKQAEDSTLNRSLLQQYAGQSRMQRLVATSNKWCHRTNATGPEMTLLLEASLRFKSQDLSLTSELPTQIATLSRSAAAAGIQRIPC